VRTVAIVDVETAGLDPRSDGIIEVGYVVWSGVTIRSGSTLIESEGNAAEDANHIPPAALQHAAAVPIGVAIAAVTKVVRPCDVIAGHFVGFDRRFLEAAGLQTDRPWLSTDDMPWPLSKPGVRLTEVALCHGVGVTSAHRALVDCQLIAALFERMLDRGMDLEAMFAHALRPKAVFQAVVSFEEKDAAKAAGFAWDAKARQWLRAMPPEDAAKLPFEVREMPHLGVIA
jgi:DNA polymerase III subunit epsilon